MNFYWNAKTWDVQLAAVTPDGYRRIPTWAAIALAPLMGALYVMFLPTVGFVMLAIEGWRRLIGRTAGRPTTNVGATGSN